MRNLKVFTCVILAFSFIVLFLSLSTAFYGFDFSDEGFYLNWISRPYEYAFSTTQFGFIYHPIYVLLGGDIAWLRFCNLLFTFILSCFLFWTLFDSPRIRSFFGDSSQDVLLGTALAIFCSLFVLLSFRLWLLSPNYNTLNFQALLLVLIGVYRLYSDQGSRVISRILIVVGGCLCFMAKPTTALLLVFIVFGQLLLCKRRQWKEIVWVGSGSIALSVLLAAAIDGSPATFFFDRISGGLAYVEAMAEHSFGRTFRIDSIPWSYQFSLIFCLTVVVPIVIRLLPHAMQVAIYVLSSVFAIFVLFGLALGFMRISDYLFAGVFVFGPLVSGLILISRRLLSRKRDLLFAVGTALYAYAYALGSGNNYWLLISGASVFIIFGLLHLILIDDKGSSGWPILVPLSSVLQLVCVLVVGLSVLYPYRQSEPLFLQNERVDFGQGELILSAEASLYVKKLSGLFIAAGFAENEPVIDMTGHYPGALFLLKAKPIVHPWILGGYPGSDNFFKQGMLQTKCEELARAWLLVEKDGPRPISHEALNFVGLDIEKDYEVIGTVESLLGEYQTTFTQVVYRPFGKSSSDLINCRR